MLKKCKYLLFGLGLLFCVNFSSAGYVDLGTVQSVTAGQQVNLSSGSCIRLNNQDCTQNAKFYEDGVLQSGLGMRTSTDVFCFLKDGYYKNGNSSSCSLFVNNFSSFTYFCPSCPECQECEECETCPTTGEILSGACDINYCVENDLCPTSTGSRSELVINDVVHEGKPLINLNIPDYIYWDYTGNENQYDIYIGSGYDQNYIDSILAINSYRPDSKDFTQIFVSGLTLIFPYIFVALLIVFMWKLLKRIFK